MAELIDFAVTDRQRQIVKLVEKKSYREAAKDLGVSSGTVSGIMMAVRRRASRQGFSPEHGMTKVVPDTHYLKGTSTLYGPDGETKLQWVKSSADKDRLDEIAIHIAESISSSIIPVKPVAPERLQRTEDQMVAYPIGDAHIGLYCWGEDSEADWDCKIAEEVMTRCFSELLSGSPNTKEALLVNLGDWFHTDTQKNVTLGSGHQLDVDTRWAKVARVGVRLMRKMIDSLLLKHERIRVINAVGNHDQHTSTLLSISLDAAYEKEPRCEVDTSPDAFHFHEWGNNLIGVHHGDKAKPEALYRVMAEDQREASGRCPHRYWYTGHIHHMRAQDIGGQQIESFRTIIPRDAYAHQHGHRAPRKITSIALHKEHGECGRKTVNVSAFA